MRMLWKLMVVGYRSRLRAALVLLIVAIVMVWLLYVGAKGGGCKPHC
jgi:hypothetical protein